MSLKIERAVGKLIIFDGYDVDECYPDTYAALKRDFVATVGVSLPSAEDLGFVVYGHQTPAEENKGLLWVNFGRNNEFATMYYFAAGKWIDWLQWANRVHRLIGDAENPPTGYRTLNGGNNLPDLSAEFKGAPPQQIYSAIWVGVPST